MNMSCGVFHVSLKDRSFGFNMETVRKMKSGVALIKPIPCSLVCGKIR